MYKQSKLDKVKTDNENIALKSKVESLKEVVDRISSNTPTLPLNYKESESSKDNIAEERYDLPFESHRGPVLN